MIRCGIGRPKTSPLGFGCTRIAGCKLLKRNQEAVPKLFAFKIEKIQTIMIGARQKSLKGMLTTFG